MTEHAGPDWALIRHRYEETQDAVAGICRDAGITERELSGARKKWKWRRKLPRPFPPVRNPRDRSTAEGMLSSASRGGDRGGGTIRSKERPVSPLSRSNSGSAAEAVGGVNADNPALDAEAPVVEAPTKALSSSTIPRRLLATPAARRRLLERLVVAISMKLEQLERRMSIDLASDEEMTATDHERETRAIGALIDNLEKIRELETGLVPSTGKSGPAATTDLADEADRCRRELAERLSRLVETVAKGS